MTSVSGKGSKQGSVHARAILIARLILAAIFLGAGISKIVSGNQFLAFADFRVLPVNLIVYAAVILPWAEIVLGILLLFNYFKNIAALTALCFSIAFIGTNLYALISGSAASCNCFGGILPLAHWQSLIIDAVMLMMAVSLWRDRNAAGRMPPKTPKLKVLQAVGAGLIILTTTINLLPAYVLAAGLEQNSSQHPLMHPTQEQLDEWEKDYRNALAPSANRALVESATPLPSSYSLLDDITYVPADRDQGYAGNCWVWAGTGLMETALAVDEKNYDRLSIQYFDSNYNGGTAGSWAGCSGDLTTFASYYSSSKKIIPWSNTNAGYQDGNQACSDGAKVKASSITTTPYYPVSSSIAAASIPTTGVDQKTAINNIKSYLVQGQAVYFGFYLSDDGWYDFIDSFWDTQSENTVIDLDTDLGNPTTEGHGVVCVGYNDNTTVPYWIMLNSWGAPSNRPDGLFLVSQSLNYSSTFTSGSSSIYCYKFQVLNNIYDDAAWPAVTTDAATDITGTSATLNCQVTSLGSTTTNQVSFEWGTISGKYPYTTSSITATTAKAYSIGLTGLTPATTYYYRARTVGNGTGYGDEKTFTTAKVLTVTGIIASNKTYDGNTTATLDTSGATLVGVADNDDVILVTSGAAGTFADKNVGTTKTVTVSGLTIGGDNADNYYLTQPTATADITVEALTVSATGVDRAYDDNTDATVTLSDDRISGDVFTDSYTSATFDNADIGTGKAVSVSGISISGTDAGNYNLQNTTAVTTANITARALTVTGITASNKTYDGNTDAILTGTASLVGVIEPDVVSLNGSATGTFADKNVGTGKTVTITGLTIGGDDVSNYSLTPPTTTANITAKALTVTGITASDKVYDGKTTATLNTSGATLGGVVSGDTVTLVTSGATGAFANKNVGTNKTVAVSGLTLGGTATGNYSLTQPTTTANITAKALTVGATGVNKVYNGSTNATVTLSDNRITGDVLTDSYTSAAFANANVGTAKTVSVSGISISGTDAGNYNLQNTTAVTTANITAKALTVTGITASDKVYDGNTTATLDTSSATLTGVVDTEDVTLDTSGATGTFANKKVGTKKTVTVSGLTLGGTATGNYSLTQPTTTANITTKALTVGATGVNKVYDGSTGATVTLSDDRITGDVFTDSYTSATFADANVGTAKTISVSGISISGTDAGNYNLLNTTATTTADITNSGGSSVTTTTTTTTSSSSSSSSSSGGGGGGGGGPVVSTEVALTGLMATDKLNLNIYGVSQAALQLTTADNNCTLGIPKGTTMLDASGKPLATLTAAKMTSVPDPPVNNSVIAAYDFGPDGATFAPPITITLHYDPASLPANVDTIQIAMWDGTKWTMLNGTVDTTNNTVSAKVSDFTDFALMAEVKPAPAKFAITGFTITPDAAQPDEKVVIQAVVANTGGSAGEYTCVIKINNGLVLYRDINLEGGKSVTVLYEAQRSVPGTYNVDINGNVKQFTVVSPQPVETAAAPEPATTTPAETTTVPSITTRTTTPVPQPTTETTLTTTEQNATANHSQPAMLAAIIAVPVIIVLASLFILRKRQKQ